MTNEVPYLRFQGQRTWSEGSWCSEPWCRSVVVWPGNSRPNGVTTTGGRPPRPHSRHSPHLLSLISFHPFHPGGDRCGATYIPTRSHSSTPPGPPSLVRLPPPLPQLLSFIRQKEVPTTTRRKFWPSRPTSGGRAHWILWTCISPRRPRAPWTTPPTLIDALLLDREVPDGVRRF